MKSSKSNARRIVFITGSSAGIGEHTAYEFAKHGYCVVITYKSDKESGERVAEKCKQYGSPETLLLCLDVLDGASIKSAVDSSVGVFGKIDVLIHNAGTLTRKKIVDQDFSEIERQVRTNLEGVIKMTQIAIPHVKDHVVFIGSTLGFVGKGAYSVYSATKFALRGFSRSIANEYRDIKINTIHPGPTATRMGGFRGEKPEVVARVIYDVVSGRIAVKSGGDLLIRDITVFGRGFHRIIAFLRGVKRLANDIFGT